MLKIKEFIRNNKKNVGIGAIFVVISGLLVWINIRDNSYAIYMNGELVSIVKSKEEAQQVYEKAVSDIKQEVGKEIVIESKLNVKKVHSKKNEIEPYEEALQDIRASISYGVNAYEVVVDGKQYAVVDSREEGINILTEIAEGYLPRKGNLTLGEEVVHDKEATMEMKTEVQEDMGAEILEVKESVPKEEVATKISVDAVNVEDEKVKEGQKIERNIQSYDFNEEIVIRNIYVDEKSIVTPEVAKEKLSENKYETKEYSLVEGDNIWDVAMKFSTTPERIMALNPSIKDETKLQIGQALKVEQATPILTITTVEESTYKGIIPADIEYIEFSDLYKDETKVYQEGNDGLKEMTVSVTKQNNKEVSRTLISEKIITEPKTKVIAFGTKEKPKPPSIQSTEENQGKQENTSSSTSSRNFLHPLKGAGVISSGYGSRWGSFHKGMDFAASAGTPIYASLAGEVIYSGYNNGGYGKLIILQHANGYQTYYAHNSSLYVNVGQKVARGEHIAGVGSTGDSTGNHLHFEIRKNGSPVNPANYI